jgi:hypothetical protein
MSSTATITVFRPRSEVERLWREWSQGPEGASVTFRDAPADHGTEIHVAFEQGGIAGKLGEVVKKVGGSEPSAKAKDELRRFKQRIETGVIAVSDAAPEGELAERKLKQRPAQPVSEPERERAAV